MKPFEYYSTPQISYPDKRDYITLYVYDKGDCIYTGNVLSKTELKEKYPNSVIQEVLDEDTYKSHLGQFVDKLDSLEQEFQEDLFKAYGVSDNPKRFKCFELAWERGHAYGHSEVYNCFGDLVELIRD